MVKEQHDQMDIFESALALGQVVLSPVLREIDDSWKALQKLFKKSKAFLRSDGRTVKILAVFYMTVARHLGLDLSFFPSLMQAQWFYLTTGEYSAPFILQNTKYVDWGKRIAPPVNGIATTSGCTARRCSAPSTALYRAAARMQR